MAWNGTYHTDGQTEVQELSWLFKVAKEVLYPAVRTHTYCLFLMNAHNKH